MKKIWVHKADSFEEAESFYDEYYLSMTPSEKLEVVQFLREQYFKIKRISKNEIRKRLRGYIKVIQQT